MPQTAGAMSFRNAVVEYSTNGTTWNDFSGIATGVEVSGGDRAQGEAYTGDADTAIVTIGKREPLQIGINVVYSEATGDHYVNLENAYINGTPIRVRWAPRGSATGNFRYTSDTGYITAFAPPGGEYESGDPILIEMEIVAPSYARAAI